MANPTLEGSQPDWAALGHVDPPDGAPHVLVVLIDDAGVGNAGTFGGPIETPNYTRMAQQGVRYNRFHVTAALLADAGGAADRSHAVGFGSVGEFSTGFAGYTAFVPDDRPTLKSPPGPSRSPMDGRTRGEARLGRHRERR